MRSIRAQIQVLLFWPVLQKYLMFLTSTSFSKLGRNSALKMAELAGTQNQSRGMQECSERTHTLYMIQTSCIVTTSENSPQECGHLRISKRFMQL